jgi:hypothetical protein
MERTDLDHIKQAIFHLREAMGTTSDSNLIQVLMMPTSDLVNAVTRAGYYEEEEYPMPTDEEFPVPADDAGEQG